MAKKPLGILTVVSGDGWTELFKKLGADVVSGGQSMNPSVQELNQGMDNGQYENTSSSRTIRTSSSLPSS